MSLSVSNSSYSSTASALLSNSVGQVSLPDSTTTSIALKIDKKYACDFPGCTKIYNKNYTLNRHKKKHWTTGLLPCGWCNKQFVDLSSLSRHERSHSGIKPYPCPYRKTCGRAFQNSANRKQHVIKIHKNLTPPSEESIPTTTTTSSTFAPNRLNKIMCGTSLHILSLLL